jgi:glutamyl-tRNA synthetase
LKGIFRFAPSPTGYLHVGGARTAIFNWILARKTQGKFLLRIEDTDKKRSTEKSIQQILNSLTWLGIEWDDQVFFQSQHQERHQSVVQQLLEQGSAYRCFCTQDNLDKKRKKAEKESGGYLYDGTCRQLTEEKVSEKLQLGLPYSVRFKLDSEFVEFEDLIIGKTMVSGSTMDDFIIQRSDGSPVYQMAVIVDDHDMDVTTVLRGADHLSNTFKQILIYRALSWPEPQFGHVPLISGPDKVRLSKRHGATSVEEFRDQGILPEALFNYLCLLGWSPGDDSEIMNRSIIIEKFSLDRINKSPAVFDVKKLFWMNSKYIAQMTVDEFWPELNDWLKANKYQLNDDELESFRLLVRLCQPRSSTIEELKNSLTVYFKDPETYDEKGIDKFFKNGTSVALLTMFNTEIMGWPVNVFENTDLIEQKLRRFAEVQNVGAGKVIHPIRLALTGKNESPGIFELIYILGKNKVVTRIKTALEFIEKLND